MLINSQRYKRVITVPYGRSHSRPTAISTRLAVKMEQSSCGRHARIPTDSGNPHRRRKTRYTMHHRRNRTLKLQLSSSGSFYERSLSWSDRQHDREINRSKSICTSPRLCNRAGLSEAVNDGACRLIEKTVWLEGALADPQSTRRELLESLSSTSSHFNIPRFGPLPCLFSVFFRTWTSCIFSVSPSAHGLHAGLCDDSLTTDSCEGVMDLSAIVAGRSAAESTENGEGRLILPSGDDTTRLLSFPWKCPVSFSEPPL